MNLAILQTWQHHLALLFAIALAVVFTEPLLVHGKALTVFVIADKKAANDVTVCAGTAQQRGLFGTGRTDKSGRIEFKNLPEGTYLLTAQSGTQSKEVIMRPNSIMPIVHLRLSENEKSEKDFAKPLCP